MVTPQPIQLASLGMADSIILMMLALVVFGPRRLPQIGRQIGKLMFEFRKASNDFKFQMEEELRASEEAERRKKEEAERQRAAALHSTNEGQTPALAAESQASVSAPAQTVESTADVGAVEPATSSSYPEQYPAESAAADAAPTIQPPQTGEQVSASAPFSGALDQAVSEVNPDADASANAEGLSATSEAPRVDWPPPTEGPSLASPDDHPSGEDLSPGTHPKEPVSQHG